MLRDRTAAGTSTPYFASRSKRWVESCRRDLLDHIIALNERHLKRLLAVYVGCYHDDRTHLGLRDRNSLLTLASTRVRCKVHTMFITI